MSEFGIDNIGDIDRDRDREDVLLLVDGEYWWCPSNNGWGAVGITVEVPHRDGAASEAAHGSSPTTETLGISAGSAHFVEVLTSSVCFVTYWLISVLTSSMCCCVESKYPCIVGDSGGGLVGMSVVGGFVVAVVADGGVSGRMVVRVLAGAIDVSGLVHMHWSPVVLRGWPVSVMLSTVLVR